MDRRLSVMTAAIGALLLASCLRQRPIESNVLDEASLPLTPVKLLFEESEIYGVYHFGDGLGVNCQLVIDADRRFTFTWHGCLGLYDKNAGSWELNGDVLVLTPEKLNRCEGFRGMNVRFIPVRWGTRHYLIDENEMPGFCAAASGKELPATGWLRYVDYEKQDDVGALRLEGKPLIPERYRTFYEQGPVTGTVVRIEGGKVILDRGTRDRVQAGMVLAGPEGSEVRILSVGDAESTGRAFYYWNSRRRIAIGDAFGTGLEYQRPRGTGFERFADPPE